MQGSETTPSEPTYGSERDQPGSRKQTLVSSILHAHLCVQPHAFLLSRKERTGQREGVFWFTSNTSKPGKATGNAFKMPFMLAPACVDSPSPSKLGHLRPRHPFFVNFHKSSFPFICWTYLVLGGQSACGKLQSNGTLHPFRGSSVSSTKQKLAPL